MSDKKRIVKARYWWGVLYPDGMVENWQEAIGDILQLPYAYCIHDKCKDEKGEKLKTHVHLIIVFPNTTTEKTAVGILSGLSAEGKQALAEGGHIERVNNVRHAYEYLIHNTEGSRKQGKHQYEPNERITGNDFDIRLYAHTMEEGQIKKQTKAEHNRKCLMDVIDLSIKNQCMSLNELYTVISESDEDKINDYFDTFVRYQMLLNNMIVGRIECRKSKALGMSIGRE